MLEGHLPEFFFYAMVIPAKVSPNYKKKSQEIVQIGETKIPENLSVSYIFFYLYYILYN